MDSHILLITSGHHHLYIKQLELRLGHLFLVAFPSASSLSSIITMSIIAVAGGLGDLGRLIVDALLETGKHEVYIMSRKVF